MIGISTPIADPDVNGDGLRRWVTGKAKTSKKTGNVVHPSRLENEKSQQALEILPGAEENPASPPQKNTALKETLMQFRGREEKG